MSNSPTKQATLDKYLQKTETKIKTEQSHSRGNGGLSRSPKLAKVKQPGKVEHSGLGSSTSGIQKKILPRSKLKMGALFGTPDNSKDSQLRFMRLRSSRDMEQYQEGYPNKKDHLDLKENYLFYTNQIPSKPDGDYIDVIHRDWWGDYTRLERHHGYIQWLFPIRESGMNWYSQELQLHEAKDIMADGQAKERVLTSFKMMLDFYGIELKSDNRFGRAHNWQQRFKHLNSSMHNYLRITRILKCLGELGYEHLKYQLVDFLLAEGGRYGTLSNTLESCITYWIETVKDEKERLALREHAKKYTA